MMTHRWYNFQTQHHTILANVGINGGCVHQHANIPAYITWYGILQCDGTPLIFQLEKRM